VAAVLLKEPSFNAALLVLNHGKEFANSASGVGRILKNQVSGWVRIGNNRQAKLNVPKEGDHTPNYSVDMEEIF
jgi:hypothetical protein